MSKFKIAVASVALACSSLAMAQDKPALIKQFIELQKPGIDSIARGLTQQWSDPIAAAGGQYLRTEVPEAKRESAGNAADALLKKYFDETYPVVRDKALATAPTTLTPVLDQSFSEEEMRQLVAWVSSPLSKKYQDATLQMQQALVGKVVADMAPTVEPRLQQLDLNVAKALGAPVNGGAPAKAAAKPKK